MTPYVKSRQAEFIPSTLATITYQDKQWGVPHKTNAGFRPSRRRSRSRASSRPPVEQARSRPVSPVYSQISAAIYKNVNKALSGNVTPQAALKKAQSDIDKALKTF